MRTQKRGYRRMAQRGNLVKFFSIRLPFAILLFCVRSRLFQVASVYLLNLLFFVHLRALPSNSCRRLILTSESSNRCSWICNKEISATCILSFFKLSAEGFCCPVAGSTPEQKTITTIRSLYLILQS